MPDETPAGTTATPAAQPAAAPVVAPVTTVTRTEQTVPFDRFDRVSTERDTARASLTAEIEARQALEAKVKALEKVATKAEEYRLQAESLQGRLTNTRAAAAHGIVEDELIEAVESHWRRLPETDRPAFGDMLKDWREGNEGKPAADKIPLLLKPHLLSKWAQAAEPVADATKAKPSPPGHRAPGTNGAQTSQALTATQIQEMGRRVQAGTMTRADYDAALRAGRRVAG